MTTHRKWTPDEEFVRFLHDREGRIRWSQEILAEAQELDPLLQQALRDAANAGDKAVEASGKYGRVPWADLRAWYHKSEYGIREGTLRKHLTSILFILQDKEFWGHDGLKPDARYNPSWAEGLVLWQGLHEFAGYVEEAREYMEKNA